MNRINIRKTPQTSKIVIPRAAIQQRASIINNFKQQIEHLPLARRTSLEVSRGQFLANSFKSNTTSQTYTINEEVKPIEMKSHTIKIRIISNYGDKEKLCCSEIDVLGSNKTQLAITKLELQPIKQHQNELLKLINGKLIKEDINDLWSVKWPPEPPLKAYDLVFIVHTFDDDIIDSIRIWPNTVEPDANIKRVTVVLDKKVCFMGDIPKDFGQVIDLHPDDSQVNCSKSIRELFENPTQVVDKFGILPFKPASSIEFVILGAYASTEKYGLSKIYLFDHKGDWLDLKGRSLIEVLHSGDEPPDPYMLFTDPDEKVPIGQSKKHFVAEYTPKSKIRVRFQDPIIISNIVIITMKPVIGPIDIAIKNLKIVQDGICIWTGRLRHDIQMDETEREWTTLINLYDNEEVRQKILDFAYPPFSEEEPIVPFSFSASRSANSSKNSLVEIFN